MLIGLCQRSDKAQTEQHSGGPASLLASVPGIVICGGHVALPAVCVGVARTKLRATLLEFGTLFRGLLRTNGRRVLICCLPSFGAT